MWGGDSPHCPFGTPGPGQSSGVAAAQCGGTQTYAVRMWCLPEQFGDISRGQVCTVIHAAHRALSLGLKWVRGLPLYHQRGAGWCRGAYMGLGWREQPPCPNKVSESA